MRMGVWIGFWKGKRDGGSLTYAAFYTDCSPVCLDNFLDYGKTQAGSRIGFLPRNAKEWIEDPREILLGYSPTSIRNGELNLFFTSLCGYSHCVT